MHVIEPSQYEKDKAIEAILRKGLLKPKSLWGFLLDIYRALGLRYIFFDMAAPIIITAIAAICLMMLYPLAPERHVYTALFAAAPIFFVFIVLLTETMEQASGLYALKMTCKYTIQQITAFRVLCFSLVGTVLCAPASLYFSRSPAAHGFLKVFSLSLCALFLCAFFTIFMMRRFYGRWTHFSAMALWVGIGLFPSWMLGERWELFLSQIPAAVTAVAAMAAWALLLIEIKKWMGTRKRKVAYDAGC